MKRFHIIIALVLMPLTLYTASFLGRCVSVTDGDTIKVLKNGNTVKIRLDGIDCPEPGQDYSDRAKQFTAIWTFEHEVEIQQTDTDKYGRIVARVIVGNKDISLELVRAGLAWHYKEYSKDTLLARAEEEARKAKLGIWSLPNPIPPWQYRHGDSRPAEKTETVANTVYITNTGKKYHKGGCRYLSKSKIPTSLESAVDQGYGSCSVCYGAVNVQKSKEPETKGETVYITKTGSKYHRGGCSYLRKSKIPILKPNAIRRGFGKCSRCKP